ncbi:MAG: hypothetical protein CHACPFDD_03197 [Phycisphaerae bacterium]|nr:hypothetical protein [Phycisphaerae bacterium]
MTRRRRAAVGALLAACCLGHACGQGLSTVEQATLERVALARARSQMLGLVQRLALRPDMTVGAALARSVAADRHIRAWIRGRSRTGAVRFYSDGTCEVDVSLAAAEFADVLRGALASAGDSPVAESEIRAAAARWPALWTTGSASAAERAETSKPPGWEDVALEGLDVARSAAAADARRALLEEAARLKQTNARRLSEFIESSPAIRDAVLSRFETAAEVKTNFAADQVVEAEARITIPELIRVLTDVHAAEYRAGDIRASDFREMALVAGVSELRASGMATPPEKFRLTPRFREIELDRPAWAETTLRAVGRCQTAEAPAPADRAAAARFDALDALRRQVEGLEVSPGVSVARLLGYRADLKDDVVIFLGGGRVVGGPRTTDEAVEVDVELPLARLWALLRRGMEIIEVDPPTSRPSESKP